MPVLGFTADMLKFLTTTSFAKPSVSIFVVVVFSIKYD